MPVATCAMSGSIETMPDAAEPAVAEVHVAVLAAGDATAPAHVVGEVAIGRHAPDEVRAEVAVQDAHAVSGAEHERRADRDRLLAASVVERSRHLPLPVEGESALLGSAHHQHVAEQVGAVVARELVLLCSRTPAVTA